jgi:methionyl-tRNA formyltransferase
MNIVFFGTPRFSAEVLRYLIESHVRVVAVIAKPDKPLGRSSKPQPVPVKIVAEEHGIPVYQPEKVSAVEFLPTLQSFQADIFVVAAYGEIIKQHVLDLPKIACINLHTSLLPKLRGAAPIQRAIMNGDTETGVTIMHMAKKMDAGDMIQQVKCAIGPETTYGELQAELQKIGSQALLKVIQNFETGKNTRTPQDDSAATLAPKIELEECQINWALPAAHIHNLIRGVNPEPGAWSLIRIGDQTKRLKVFRSHPYPEIMLPPLSVQLDSYKRLMVGCGQGALELIEVQLEGKKRMSAAEFHHGLSTKTWVLL